MLSWVARVGFTGGAATLTAIDSRAGRRELGVAGPVQGPRPRGREPDGVASRTTRAIGHDGAGVRPHTVDVLLEVDPATTQRCVVGSANELAGDRDGPAVRDVLARLRRRDRGRGRGGGSRRRDRRVATPTTTAAAARAAVAIRRSRKDEMGIPTLCGRSPGSPVRPFGHILACRPLRTPPAVTPRVGPRARPRLRRACRRTRRSRGTSSRRRPR